MSLSLHTIKPAKGARKSKKRIGRGFGSGSGRYSGRGIKGQKARSGVSGLKLKGLRHIMLSMPKSRGFNSNRPNAAVVNVATLAENFKNGAVISPKELLDKKLVSEIKNGVKILGNGEITIKITLKGCQASKSAVEKIEAAGGQVVLPKVASAKGGSGSAGKKTTKKTSAKGGSTPGGKKS